MLRYKGYRGEYTFDPVSKVAVGYVLIERGQIVFEGSGTAELLADMKRALDAYLDRCERHGVQPSPPVPDLPDAPQDSLLGSAG
jgi:predicted HicB family RNase H-like nuclease